MFSLKTKSGQLPSFPEESNIPKLPEIPQQTDYNFPPSFPASKISDNQQYKQEFQPIYTPLTREIYPGKEEAIGSRPRTLEISEPYPDMNIPKFIPQTRIEKSEKTGPVFVRIDKYQAAVQAFNEIQNQLNEIENYLKEIRQLKIQEEQELSDWETQIETIKARLSNIDQGVFGKLSS